MRLAILQVFHKTWLMEKRMELIMDIIEIQLY